MENKKEVILPVQYVTITIAEHSHHFNYFHIISSFLIKFDMFEACTCVRTTVNRRTLLVERGIASLNCAHSIALCRNWKIYRHNVYQNLW